MSEVVTSRTRASITWAIEAYIAASPVIDCFRSGLILKNVASLLITLLSPPAMDGYCPVSLRQYSVWKHGDPAQTVIYEDQRFLFANEQLKKRFLDSPELYAPVTMGYDIVRIIDHDDLAKGKRRYGYKYRNRTYLFSSEASMVEFLMNPARYATLVKRSEARKELVR